MRRVTFQVIDGYDKGRIFRDLPTPFTIGREEGNLICLNDERVSRCHLKIISDQEDVVVLDLDSTNGTLVNGKPITVCRLELGDCIRIGRTSLLYGSPQEVAQLIAQDQQKSSLAAGFSPGEVGARTPKVPAEALGEECVPFRLSQEDAIQLTRLLLERTDSPPPPPSRLSPHETARLVGFLELIHERLARCSREAIYHLELKNHVLIPQYAWHGLLDMQFLVSRYIRMLTQAEEWETLE